MAAKRNSQFVQQTFNWDNEWKPESESANVAVLDRENIECSATVLPKAKPATSRKERAPVTVPVFQMSSSNRRNRCEHVGGIMATVLGKYGIGIDELITAIDEARGKRETR